MGETIGVYIQLRPQELMIVGMTFLLLVGGVMYAATITQPDQKAAEAVQQDLPSAAPEDTAVAMEDLTKAGLSKTDVMFLIRGEAVG